MTALAGLLLLAAAPVYERAIEVAAPGRTALVLDREVYEGARADLGDLRIVDDGGAFVPYWLEQRSSAPAPRHEPQVLNQGFLRGGSASATLDFGSPTLKSELVVRSSGDNFRRRVAVEGSLDALRWLSLRDDAFVFAVPGPPPVRHERVTLPPNDYRYLRVTVLNGPDDPERIEVDAAWAEAPPEQAVEERITPALTRSEDAQRHESLLNLDLGARYQPFVGVVLDVVDPRFSRAVVVEARRDAPAPSGGESARAVIWVRLTEGAIGRSGEGGAAQEALRLEASGRERALRLRVRNRDDRALGIRGVSVVVPVERVIFEAAGGRHYRLVYGWPDLPAPDYDLARTIGDTRAWAASAAPARLGVVARRSLPSSSGPLPPWTERHPALLGAGLLVTVAALGFLTWRALRSAP